LLVLITLCDGKKFIKEKKKKKGGWGYVFSIGNSRRGVCLQLPLKFPT